MKIAIFNSLESAQEKRDQYNELAKPPVNPDPNFNLVNIHKKPLENIWWFNFGDCVENGGLGRDEIAADEINLEIVNVTNLIAEGYLPEEIL